MSAGREEMLLELLRRDLQAGIERFYLEEVPRIRSLLEKSGWSPDDASDVVSEVMTKLLEGELRVPGWGSPSAWVFVIAQRTLIAEARRWAFRRDPGPGPDADGHPQPGDDSVLDTLIKLERGERLKAALEALSGAERELVIGRYFDGLLIWQLTERHGVHENTIRRRLEMITKKLERMLQDQQDE